MKEQEEQGSYLNEVQMSYQRKAPISNKPLAGATDAVEVLRAVFPAGQIDLKEMSYALFLNRANHVLGYLAVSSGSVGGTIIDIAGIMRAALFTNASAIILSHNHPSGNLSPSQADITTTRKLKDAAKVFDMALVDHIILTSEGFYSFEENGIL